MAHETPILDQVNLIVGNMPDCIAFYSRLGVSLQQPPATGERDPFHVNGKSQSGMQVDLDSPSFAQFWNKGWAARQDLVGRIVLGFRLASREAVDATYAELTGAGHHGLQPPYDAFWGARYAIVEDPNGIAVGLMSPIDHSRRVWPPEGWQE